jgi:hypothetical protein
MPSLLNHLAMPGCSKIHTHWDRCGVYYVNPIDGRECVQLTQTGSGVCIATVEDDCLIGSR